MNMGDSEKRGFRRDIKEQKDKMKMEKTQRQKDRNVRREEEDAASKERETWWTDRTAQRVT